MEKKTREKRLRCQFVKQWPAYRLNEDRSIRCMGSRKMRFQKRKPASSLYAALLPEVFSSQVQYHVRVWW